MLLILFPGRRLADSKGVNRDVNHLESQGKLDSNESKPPESEHVVSLGDLQFYPSSVCVVCSINRQVVETSIVLDFPFQVHKAIGFLSPDLSRQT